jgi:hypothetical protein
MRKAYTYKVIAKSELDRKGVERECIYCRCLYRDRINSESLVVICPLCIMGRADGIEIEKPKKQKKIRIKSKKKGE